MPIPPSAQQVYDSVSSVLNASKLRMHERMPSLQAFSGTFLSVAEPGTQQAFNNAYRKMQATMANAGSSIFDASIVIEGIPAVSQDALDPSTECWISWFGCSDGIDEFTTPSLPSDLMTPYWMSERWNGSMLPFPGATRPNMKDFPDGLPKQRKVNFNGAWEWRGERIYYPGSLQSMDFLVRYQKYLPDIVDVSSSPWFTQNVPIMRCQEPLSLWLCREMCMSMSLAPELDPDVRQQFIAAVAYFEAAAMTATKLLVSPDKKRKQRMNVSRLPFAGGGRGNGGFGGGTGVPAYTGS